MLVKIEAPCGNQILTVELDSADGAKTFNEWDMWSSDKQFKKLSVFADILVVYYLKERNEIPENFYKQRVEALMRKMKAIK